MISPPLFAFQLLSTAILLWTELRRADVLQQNERKNRAANEAYTDVIGEIVRANREIKLYCGKETFLHTVRERNGNLTDTNLKKRLANNRYNLLRWNLRDVFVLVYLAILVYSVSIGRFDVAMGVVLFNYCESMLPVINIFSFVADLFKGEVCLNGINIKRLDEESIRKNISIVTQSPYILHMSVRENLRLAKNDATEEEMADACKRACIHDDIMRMEKQYDTIITAEGSNLSGGQRQRLMIAMCILKDAPILLLDEATSGLLYENDGKPKNDLVDE